MSGVTGTIVHPNYPAKYKVNRNCQYAITVTPGKRIRISFEQIDLESSETCSYDFIEIQDSDANKRIKVCRPGSSYLSAGRSIVLKFYSDENDVRGGFVLRWAAVDPPSITTTPSISTTTTTTLAPTPSKTTTTTRPTDKRSKKTVLY